MADEPLDHRLPSLMAIRKSEELPLTVGHQRMFKLSQGVQQAYLPVHKSPLGIHQVEFFVQSRPGRFDGG
jgi:hypothetical protein